MTIAEAAEALGAAILTTCASPERPIDSVCGADMMSDVMAYFHGQGLLLTGLNNIQTIRTANVMDIRAVCLIRGKTPGADMISLAEEFGIVIMRTDYRMYESCGRLWEAGLH